MIRRNAEQRVREALKQFPAVALLGPRQVGKTTLGQLLGKHYYDLEVSQEQLTLNLDWPKITEKNDLIVLDEAHAYPDIFPQIRHAIDKRRNQNGRFLLVGSISPALMTHVSESLAGRIATVQLSPVTCYEATKCTIENIWLHGGFPKGGVLNPSDFPEWQKNYLFQLVNRDLPIWGLPANPLQIEKLIHMLATLHGQTWNAHQFGKNLGITHPTANSYLDFLEGTFLLRRLKAYSGNVTKRLTKTPKVYWRDTGLLHCLLNISDYKSLLRHPVVGASWEGFVIEQILNFLNAQNIDHDAFFLRTTDQKEIDLVLDFGGMLWAIEIKLSGIARLEDFQKLQKHADIIGASKRILISQTTEPIIRDNESSINIKDFTKLIKVWQ